jgi:hypothetical protein
MGTVRHQLDFAAKLECDWKRIDVKPPPPSGLVTRAMKLAVVDPADRDRELVAHSAS